MEKLTFKRQMLLGIIVLIVGNTLAFILRKGIFCNIAWILYGLLFLINPVQPGGNDSKRGRQVVRIGGILCILLGFLVGYIM